MSDGSDAYYGTGSDARVGKEWFSKWRILVIVALGLFTTWHYFLRGQPATGIARWFASVLVVVMVWLLGSLIYVRLPTVDQAGALMTERRWMLVAFAALPFVLAGSIVSVTVNPNRVPNTLIFFPLYLLFGLIGATAVKVRRVGRRVTGTNAPPDPDGPEGTE